MGGRPRGCQERGVACSSFSLSLSLSPLSSIDIPNGAGGASLLQCAQGVREDDRIPTLRACVRLGVLVCEHVSVCDCVGGYVWAYGVTV